MTRNEVQDLLAMVQGAYPNFNPANKSATVNAWTMALEDFDKNKIAVALKVYMRTNTSGFAPSPGQLIDLIQIVAESTQIGELKAWTLVSKALRNSTYNSESEFAKLPPLVKKALGSAEQLRIWATDEHYNETVNSSNFMRTYRMVAEKERQFAKLPVEIKNLIKQESNDLKAIAENGGSK